MRLRLVPPKHYILGKHLYKSEPSPVRMPVGARGVWNHWGLGGCDGAVTMTHGGKLVGFFRFNRDRSALQACGTWVDAEWRGCNYAFNMWALVLRRFKIRSVVVTATSAGGRGLVERMRAEFPSIKVTVRT